MNETKETLYTRLLKAKREIGKATKNSTNPHFRSKYVDINALIEAVEPSLLENGLILLQPIENGKVYTRILDAVTGQGIESVMDLPANGTPQAIGSAITYYRRYTLQSLLSMQAEDDDGNQASAKQPTVKPILSELLYEKAVVKLVEMEVKEAKEYLLKLRGVYTITPKQELELNEILN